MAAYTKAITDRDGNVIYPLTIPSQVVDPVTGKTIGEQADAAELAAVKTAEHLASINQKIDSLQTEGQQAAAIAQLQAKNEELEMVLFGDDGEEAIEPITILSSNFLATSGYPARTTGGSSGSSFFSGYKVDLRGYYERGYTKVYFRGAEYTSTQSIVRGITIDTSGNVLSYIPLSASKSNGWQYLGITEDTATLWATYCRDASGGEVWTPTEVIVEGDGKEPVKGRIESIEEDIRTLSDSLDSSRENIKDLIGDSLPSIVVNESEFLATSGYPARTTGKNSASSSLSSYKVDLSGFYERGYRRVYFRGANYTLTDNITRGITLDAEGNVLSYVPILISKSNGWQYLDITEDTVMLWASYCREPGGGEVWTPTEVIIEDNGDKGRVGDLEKDVMVLKNEIGSINYHLKMLIIGNSYSKDSFMYVPIILKQYGITCDITLATRNACSLGMHNEGFFDTNVGISHINTAEEDFWSIDNDAMTLENLVMSDHWDIISLQQSSLLSHSLPSYEPNVRQLIQKIVSSVEYPFKLAWNININRNSTGETTVIQNLILQNIHSVTDVEPIDFIFPYGTAIFNARTNATLDALGDQGHLWFDNVHLQEGIPRYIAGLANVQALFKVFYPQYSVLGDKLRINDNMLRLWGIYGTNNGSCVGINEENCLLAQICAILANKKPFEITDINQ